MSTLTVTQTASGRQRLAELLVEAAELEHALLCQYLYSWFSMKRSPAEGVSWQQLELMRQWGASLLLVARQEMEHLGLVSNLLSAIGEAPNLRRPEFPLGERHYDLGIPCLLQPFGLEALQRYIAFETPQTPTADELAALEQAGLSAIPRNSIAELYAEIRSLLNSLASAGADLFVGPPGAQFDTPTIIPVPIRGVQTPNHPVYDIFLIKVVDLTSALAVIDQIVLEGEGGPGGSPTSHFARFVSMYKQLRDAQSTDPGFRPARAVIADPNAVEAVTAVPSLAVCDLFDSVYATVLLLLYRFFAHTDESQSQLFALQHAAFFPMMTGVLRPLGEVCTLLPATSDGQQKAAPAFSLPGNITLLPHRRAAWRVILESLQSLSDRSGTLAADTNSYTPYVCDRLTLVHQNLVRITSDFATNMGDEQ